MSLSASSRLRPPDDPRAQIARRMVAFAMVAITAISVVALVWAGDDRAQAAQIVFTAVLPVVGTWVGTVLAYYFSRENLLAANEATLRAIETAGTFGAPGRLVSSAMVPFASIKPLIEVDGRAEADALTLEELTKLLDRHDQKRLPVVARTGRRPLLVVHRSHLDGYRLAASGAQGAVPTDPTLGDLRDDDDLKARTEAFVVVPPTATIDEARTALAGVKGCRDVFVTEDGTRGSRVVGWVTDRLLLAPEV